ncbi:hypothetical protein EUGRSUZ_E03248 [Eucalyptus grandis]|uniref:Uncharacterized protein n=2 Tax=Eucalyptus grandis TaxID=71139 RepID=A0ACC3KZ66_EUCGR|nr:hypothetical protein EUGRSUZ_E03248 [Eucalyptus grandis]
MSHLQQPRGGGTCGWRRIYRLTHASSLTSPSTKRAARAHGERRTLEFGLELSAILPAFFAFLSAPPTRRRKKEGREKKRRRDDGGAVRAGVHGDRGVPPRGQLLLPHPLPSAGHPVPQLPGFCWLVGSDQKDGENGRWSRVASTASGKMELGLC